MKKYIIGMDGGGTSTKAKLYPVQDDGQLGEAVEGIIVGSTNVNSNSHVEIQENFHKIWQALGSEHVLAVGLGVAGLSTVGAEEKLRTYMRHAGFPEQVTLKGDHEIALRGAFDKQAGMLLIAGTGSICFGQSPSGHLTRAGGYGYLIDDIGSAFSIGLSMLKHWIWAYDKRIESSAMLEHMTGEFAQSGVPLDVAMDLAYHQPFIKARIADLASIFSMYLERGDIWAEIIAEEQLEALATLVKTVRKSLDSDKVPLVYSGGVLVHNQIIREKLSLRLEQEGIVILDQDVDAPLGAARFAKEDYYARYVS